MVGAHSAVEDDAAWLASCIERYCRLSNLVNAWMADGWLDEIADAINSFSHTTTRWNADVAYAQDSLNADIWNGPYRRDSLNAFQRRAADCSRWSPSKRFRSACVPAGAPMLRVCHENGNQACHLVGVKTSWRTALSRHFWVSPTSWRPAASPPPAALLRVAPGLTAQRSARRNARRNARRARQRAARRAAAARAPGGSRGR